MATLTVTNEQLRLIQSALDMYSRIGIGQMWVIKEHPTFYNVLRDKLRPKEEIKEWKDVENVKLSIDYSLLHDIQNKGEKILNQGRNILLQEELHDNASYGIYNTNVDNSCRVAFDIIQVIRHEFWKADPYRSSVTVDSSVHLSTTNTNQLKCQID